MKVMRKGIDFQELTIEELNNRGIPVPDEPDTEDGKYLLFSISGILKLCPRIYLCNSLWINFTDCLNLKIGNEKFIRSSEYIDSLIKVKYNSKFEPFTKIIEIALDNPDLLLKYKSNLNEFTKLGEGFGKEYGCFDSLEPIEEKPLEFCTDFYFTLLNKYSETIEVI